jgi:hypothetical protein
MRYRPNGIAGEKADAGESGTAGNRPSILTANALSAAYLPCRSFRLTIVGFNVGPTAYRGDSRLECLNEDGDSLEGQFTGRAWIVDETLGITVSKDSCPNCVQSVWVGATGGATSADHCYRTRISGVSIWTSAMVPSEQRCAADGGGDRDEEYADQCDSSCNSPLVLDLNGDGISTTSLSDPVQFDLDADGSAETLAWTHPATEEGFLWRDLDPNGVVDDGRELFGVGTRLPDGRRAADGFEALRVYDATSHGGDGDGRITSRDGIWSKLRLWIDRNHDGVSQHTEVAPIHRYGITALELTYVVQTGADANGNEHRFAGTYGVRDGSTDAVFEMTDVFFVSR